VALAGEMFATRGFAGTTVREIADAAGILSGSLYHHFDSKESIVDELLSSFLDETMAAYQAAIAAATTHTEALRALVQIAFAGLMLLIAWRMVRGAPREEPEAAVSEGPDPGRPAS